MKKQAHLKSNEASTEQKADATAQSGASADQSGKARRKKSEAPELPVPQAIASLAISALAISNSADTILRKAGADFGLADWALMQTLGAQAEAQTVGWLSRFFFSFLPF